MMREITEDMTITEFKRKYCSKCNHEDCRSCNYWRTFKNKRLKK